MTWADWTSDRGAWARFPATWVLDTEFSHVAGNRPVPVAVCAVELRSGRRVRLWMSDLVGSRPFYDPDKDLIVTFYGIAETTIFCELDWPLPRWHVDLFVEWANMTNGTGLRRSLLAVAKALDVEVHVSAYDKEDMRVRIGSGELTAADRGWVLDYCDGDVDVTAAVFSKLTEQIGPDALELDRALVRGRFVTACALVERAGIPIDADTAHALARHWRTVRRRLLVQLDEHRLLEDGVFRRERFAGFLRDHRIEGWPRTSKGEVCLDDDTFREQSRMHSAVQPVRDLRALAGQLREWQLRVGSDGRARCAVRPFATRTGRCAPSTSEFIFAFPKWARNLIRPEPGTALAYVDLKSAELGVAAALSGDTNMLDVYAADDPYVRFGVLAGLLPDGATKVTHAEARNRIKTVVLGLQYGMRPKALARGLDVPEHEAVELVRAHEQTFTRFWRWADRVNDTAQLTGGLSTPLGWRLHRAERARPTSVQNHPVQAAAGSQKHGPPVLKTMDPPAGPPREVPTRPPSRPGVCHPAARRRCTLVRCRRLSGG